MTINVIETNVTLSRKDIYDLIDGCTRVKEGLEKDGRPAAQKWAKLIIKLEKQLDEIDREIEEEMTAYYEDEEKIN